MDGTDNTSAIWKALGDPTRRRILDLLRKKPDTTGAIAAEFPDLSRFAIMKHLGVLEEASLIVVRRKGRERWNHLNALPLRELYERWISTLDDQWATSMLDIGRLSASAAGQDKHEPDKEKTMTDTQTLQQFSVEQEHRIAADAATVFNVLTTRVGEWHPHPYRLHEGNSDLRLDARPGGALVEYWEDDSFAIWATISRLEPNEKLEFEGPWGMSGAVHGKVKFHLEADGDATVLKLSHHAIGEIDAASRENYSNGWTDLMGKLKTLVEG